MANQVVHFQIMGNDAPALRSFYQRAFDWEITPIGGPAEYALVENAGMRGGIGACPEGGSGHVTFFVGVEDINAAIRKVESLGATNVSGPWPIPSGGHMATFADPQGQMIGLFQE